MKVLQALGIATNGTAYHVKDEETMKQAYAQIEKDLRTQYLLSFESESKPSNKFHEIEVKVSGATTVRAPAGYFY